jgi:hypothetical protein
MFRNAGLHRGRAPALVSSSSLHVVGPVRFNTWAELLRAGIEHGLIVDVLQGEVWAGAISFAFDIALTAMVNNRTGHVNVSLFAYHRPAAPRLMMEPQLLEGMERGDVLVICTTDEDDRDRFAEALAGQLELIGTCYGDN